MSNLLQSFIPEARDLIKAVVDNLLKLEDAPTDPEVIEELFRAMHTLKGSSGIFDLPPFTGLTHTAEDLLDDHRRSGAPLTSDAIDRLLGAADVLIDWIDALDDTGALPPDAAEVAREMGQKISAMSAGGAAADDEADEDDEVVEETDAFVAMIGDQAAPLMSEVAEIAASYNELTAIRYTPATDAFFAGDDPLLTWGKVPDLLGWRLETRAPWPDKADLDPYQCNVVFVGISAAPRADLAHLFRYVSDEVALASVTQLPELDAIATAPPAVAEARPAPTPAPQQTPAPAAGPGARPGLEASRTRLEMAKTLISRQIDVIQVADLGSQGGAGRLAAVEQALINIARGVPPLGPSAESVPVVFERALNEKNTAPIRAALEEQLSVLDGLLNAQTDEPADAPAAAAPEAAVAEVVAHPATSAAPESAPAPKKAAAVGAKADTAENSAPAEATPATKQQQGGGKQGSGPSRSIIRVEESRLDTLMNLIGELVVAKNALPYLAQRAHDEYEVPPLAGEINSQYTIVDRLAQEMQTEILQLRMMPISEVFDRFPRLVRDISRKLGKKVQLTIEGGDTEVDKSIVEGLGDPMIHIIRNALDHGLETPEERAAFDKSETGTLKISAHSEADQIIVEVLDDGRGINRDKVKKKAIERGMITREEAASMPDEAALELIFKPGFSTNTEVTDLSGRGVGMDVALTTIKNLGGRLQVLSELGKWTKIRLSLPLSMAISRLVVVSVGQSLYGIPMDLIFQMVRVEPDEIKLVQGREVIVLRGEIVPLIRLKRIFDGNANGTEQNGSDAIVVTASGNQLFGFVVDDLHERMETIVKPMEGVVAGLPGFIGTSLMGDGRVLLVLNPEELAHAHAH